MQILFIVAGLVGVILPSHFVGQHPLGWALLILGVVLLILPLLAFFTAKRLIDKHDNMAPRGSPRSRRGF